MSSHQAQVALDEIRIVDSLWRLLNQFNEPLESLIDVAESKFLSSLATGTAKRSPSKEGATEESRDMSRNK